MPVTITAASDQGGNELVSFEPATGAALWRGPTGDIDSVVARARESWPAWAARPLTERIEQLRGFVNRMRADAERFADMLARETGRPIWEARGEVETIAQEINVAIKAYAERASQRRLEGKAGAQAALRHKPHGVMAVITPFCAPAEIAARQIIPALMAGNVVILKPSERTPASAELLIGYFVRAGLGDGQVQLLQGGPAIGQALTRHDGIDGVLFTGSTRTGLALSRALANRPDRLLSLHLSGNNPIVIWDTPDFHAAAVLTVQSAFLSAGQRCTAARRAIVAEHLAEPFLVELKRLADRLIIDEPYADPQPFMGPVIDSETADGITESFVALISRGGHPIKHMIRALPQRPFVSPGIIDVTGMTDRPDIELFGPLLQIVRVPDFDAAIREANSSRYGLTAALIGGTAQQYDAFWANSRAGMVHWNTTTHATSAMAPVGGVGLSGNGRPGGFYAPDASCYPVVSLEAEMPRGMIGIGLNDDQYGGGDLSIA